MADPPAPPSSAAASHWISGRDLAQHSSGVDQGEDWVLDANGYAGSFLRVDRPGRVTFTLQAKGLADGGAVPRARLVVADTQSSFEIGPVLSDHVHAADLAAGTYLVRIDFVNDAPDANRQLTIGGLRAQGATLLEHDSDAIALEAADSYVRCCRQGRARVVVRGGKAGAKVKVKLARHAFNFGVNIPFRENKLLLRDPAPGSDASWYQGVVLERFNTVVLSNGGKWLYQEAKRDRHELDYIDRFLEFAEQHRLRARMHTLIWDTVQQPAWVASEDPQAPGLLTQAKNGAPKAKHELTAEIAERIDYYVRQRARRYLELDVINESLHKARYFQVYGAPGIARIFNQAKAAVTSAGGATRLYLNEYNLLQWSSDPLSGAPDPYANWYRWHAEQIRHAGGAIDGLGVQYYPDGRGPDAIGASAHSPARIFRVLQNLSGTTEHLSLTEFSVNSRTAPPERAADILEHTLRLVFGTAVADSFLIWAIWAGAADPPVPSSALYDREKNATPPGARYAALMKAWHTELELALGADASFEFTGFYGDYAITLDRDYPLTLTKGQTEYAIEASAPAR